MVMLGTIALTGWLYVIIPKGFFPQQDTGIIVAIAEGAQDISFPAMSDRVKAVAATVKQDPAVYSVTSYIGAGGATATLNQGRMFITLKPQSERDVTADQVIARLNTRLANVEGITLYMQASQDITVGARLAKTQYQYTLTDADQNELNHWSAIFLDKLRSIPGIADVTSDQENAGPRLDVTVNREVASSYGILPSTVDNTLDDAFGQRIVSTMYTPLNQYHVVLEVDPRFQTGPDGLRNVYVNSSTGQQVPLSTLVNSKLTASPILINHQGMFPSATISFNLKPGVALGDAVAAIRAFEKQSGKPASLVTSFQGNANAFLSALSGELLLVLAALFALSERAPVNGEALMLAYAVGFEAGVRSGRTAPGHHKGGWHLTGTLGSIAAGVAAGKLLKLDAQKLTYAMGIASTQAAGMQQNRGTMCKSFHAGKAASNGVLAALLAERGFDSTQEIIEGKKGFSRIYSDVAEPEQLLAGLNKGWLIESNGHKPYACGVVLHPLIDAVIAIRNRDKIDPAQVSEIALRVNPLVLSITGVVDPSTGLQSKFSTLHSAAVALIDGHAGMAQYSDAKAVDPAVATLRRKVKPVADDTLRKDEAHAVITVAGQRHEVHIDHASGTAENRMTDAQIEAKFLANATPAIGDERARRAAAFVWALEKQPDARELIGLLA